MVLITPFEIGLAVTNSDRNAVALFRRARLLLLAARCLGLAMLAAAQRIGVAARLVGRLRLQLRNLQRVGRSVDGYKDQVGAGHMQ